MKVKERYRTDDTQVYAIVAATQQLLVQFICLLIFSRKEETTTCHLINVKRGRKSRDWCENNRMDAIREDRD